MTTENNTGDLGLSFSDVGSVIQSLGEVVVERDDLTREQIVGYLISPEFDEIGWWEPLGDLATRLGEAATEWLKDHTPGTPEPVPAPPPPLALVRVMGGIAEEWYTVAGTGSPEVYILDFDREGEDDENRAQWIVVAREVLATFTARGMDTDDLGRDLDEMEPEA